MPYTKPWSMCALVVFGMLALSCSSTSSRPRSSLPEPLPEAYSPAPRVSVPPTPTLQSDPMIRQIQGVLQERGYNPGPLDGVLGKKTKEALRRFQKDHRLAVTGEITADTKSALLSPAPSSAEAIEKGGTY